jgi:vacuolar-type H+-ATPase subunit H
MASKEVTSDIASLETQAETILAEAREKAAEILRAANRDAAGIAAEQLPLDGVKRECAVIIEKAKEQARTAVQQSAREADLLKTRARSERGKAFQAIVRTIESMVRGAR